MGEKEETVKRQQIVEEETSCKTPPFVDGIIRGSRWEQSRQE